MKLVEQISNIEVENVGESINFTMKSNPKAFKILADSLYSDKISAVIRELSTNAYDSHVDAGCEDKPFDVFLPSWNSNNFYIRDYGVGLDDKQIETVYSTFFESTKTESNDFIGCLGLGSKTPFSYNTKTFTVTAWKNGKKWIYSCYYKDGIPALSKLSEEDSDEPNGLKVEFPVSINDTLTFENKSKKVYSFFKVFPNFLNKKITLDVPEYIIDEPNFKLRKYDSSYRDSRSHVLMGMISYPIDSNYSEFTEEEKNILSSGFLILSDVGYVEMTPSREGLEYTSKTVRRIKAKLKEIIDFVSKDTQVRVDKENTFYEAACKLEELKSSIDQRVKISWNSITYKGVKISKVLSNLQISLKYFSYRSSSKGYTANSISCNINNRFYVNDSSYAIQRMVIKKRDLHHKDSHIYYYINNKETLDTLKKELGIPDSCFYKTSDLPTPSISRTNSVDKMSTVSQYVHRKTSFVTEYWKNTKIDLADPNLTGVMAVKNRYNFVVNGRELDTKNIYNILELFTDAGIEVPNIYAVKKSDQKHIPKSWDTFENWYNSQFKSKEFQKMYLDIQKAKYYKQYASIENTLGNGIKKLENCKNKLISDFVKYLNEYYRLYCKLNTYNINPHIVSIHYTNHNNEIKSDLFELIESGKSILKKYPLLKFISEYHMTPEIISELNFYINSVDKK